MIPPFEMHAARLHGFGQPLMLERIATPTPGPGQILVRVLACGVCHTDLHACHGDWRAKPPLPLIPGHEIVGEVVALGTGVERPRLGDRVGIFWLNHACGSCAYCSDGWESLCPKQINTGFGVPGGFAEYVVVHADFAIPIPPNLEPTHAAPLLCAGVSAWKAVRETGLRPGETLAIVGIGGVGHLAVAYAKSAGLRVVAVDVDDMALSLARDMGADEIVRSDTERLPKQAHGVLVAANNSSAIRLGIELLRRNGVAILVGLPPGNAELPVFDVVVKRLTVRGSIGGTRHDVASTLAAGVMPRVEVRDWSGINDVFEEMTQGAIRGRVVLRFPTRSE